MKKKSSLILIFILSFFFFADSVRAKYWLVIGTPASSIVYASGQLQSKDFIRMATLGWPAALIALSLIIILWWTGPLGIPTELVQP